MNLTCKLEESVKHDLGSTWDLGVVGGRVMCRIRAVSNSYKGTSASYNPL